MSDNKQMPSVSQELYPSRPSASDTIVVLGSPRGGTSMVAGILRLLGVHMGGDVGEGNNEDLEFTAHKGNRRLFHDEAASEDKEAFLAHLSDLVEKRNAEHASWGWKDPISTYYIGNILPKLRNPRLVCVVRDAAAVVGRQLLSQGVKDDRDSAVAQAFATQFRLALGQYSDMIDAVTSARVPTLMISYERATRHPKDIIREMARFIGRDLPTDPEALRKLMEYVMPERISGNINVEVNRQPQATPVELTAPLHDMQDGLERLRSLDQSYQAAIENAVEEHGRLPSAENENSRIILQSMAAATKAKDFQKLKINGYRLLDSMAYKSPELIHHPQVLYAMSTELDSAPWPPAVLQVFFKLGMMSTQNNDPAVGYWYFACIIQYLEQRPKRYRGQPFPIPFWGTLFHLGLSAKLIGRTGLAKQTFARIVHAETLKLQPDTEALAEEANEHANYAKRATVLLDR